MKFSYAWETLTLRFGNASCMESGRFEKHSDGSLMGRVGMFLLSRNNNGRVADFDRSEIDYDWIARKMESTTDCSNQRKRNIAARDTRDLGWWTSQQAWSCLVLCLMTRILRLENKEMVCICGTVTPPQPNF
jgi:hypothetical protein